MRIWLRAVPPLLVAPACAALPVGLAVRARLKVSVLFRELVPVLAVSLLGVPVHVRRSTMNDSVQRILLVCAVGEIRQEIVARVAVQMANQWQVTRPVERLHHQPMNSDRFPAPVSHVNVNRKIAAA